MKKKLIAVTAAVLFLAAIGAVGQLFLSEERGSEEQWLNSGMLMVDNTIYDTSDVLEELVLPDSFCLVGVVRQTVYDVPQENFTGSIAAGAEIYQSPYYPGWLYVFVEGTGKWLRMTVWELQPTLLRYQGKIYFAADEVENHEAYMALLPKTLAEFSEGCPLVGVLQYGAADTIPAAELEVNTELYQNAELYADPGDPSALHAKIQYQGNTWFVTFYDAALCGISYDGFRSSDME